MGLFFLEIKFPEEPIFFRVMKVEWYGARNAKEAVDVVHLWLERWHEFEETDPEKAEACMKLAMVVFSVLCGKSYQSKISI